MKPQLGPRIATPADRFPNGPAEPGRQPAPDAFANLAPAPVLLHSCCAPCSSAILEWLLARRYAPTVFFYNPNIFPREEYDVRRRECIRYCDALGVPYVDGDYEHDRWREAVRGLENEPERGARCLVCFKTRMRAAALAAKSLGIEHFTTTLAGSRWKRLEQIREAAEKAAELVGGVRYWDMDWKKGGLQNRRSEIIREQNFYNQLWCGCEFSMRHLAHRDPEELPAYVRSYVREVISQGLCETAKPETITTVSNPKQHASKSNNCEC